MDFGSLRETRGCSLMRATQEHVFQQVETIRTNVRDRNTYGLRCGIAAYGHCFASRKDEPKWAAPRIVSTKQVGREYGKEIEDIHGRRVPAV